MPPEHESTLDGSANFGVISVRYGNLNLDYDIGKFARKISVKLKSSHRSHKIKLAFTLVAGMPSWS